MDTIGFSDIYELLREAIGEDNILQVEADIPQPCITLKAESLVESCRFLHDHPSLYFDTLSCLTGIDNGPDKGSMEVLYHLYSIPFDIKLVLKVMTDRGDETAQRLPSVPSVSSVWKGADWLERETYDLFGILFTGHPDMRRIFLPEDWEGFPLRKDYKVQEYYHGIKVE